MKLKDTTNVGAAMKNSKYRNFPMVPRVIYGSGSFDQLGDILMSVRGNSEASMIFLLDDIFENNPLLKRIPADPKDHIILISTNEEPKTSQVDALVDKIRMERLQNLAGVIGIGGGSILDLAKAVAIMLNNEGLSEEYQGWDLVKNPALYHVGIPTLSGTGAEVSRTTVLLGPERKLGINSDYTTFDQVILDPELTIGVPKDQWFYTGMDCYIHCVESLEGKYINAFSRSYGEKAMELCKEVFLEDISPEERREKLMMASWHGGMSIAYSQVGVAHALSYGLSYVLGTPHGLGNCLVFRHLNDYYPEGVLLFKKMLHIHDINLPEGLTRELTEHDLDTMADISLQMEPLWENALGADWRAEVSPELIKKIYRKI